MKSKDKLIYVALGGVLASAYAVAWYFNKPKIIDISLQKTNRIVQQIKHQMFMACINFLYQIKQRVNKQKLQALSDELRQQLIGIYQKKQLIVLNKYDVNKQSFAKALKTYEKDLKLNKNRDQIMDMMERSIKGQMLNLTVDERAKQKFTKQQLKRIYCELCTKICILVRNKLIEQTRKDPYFDCKNDDSFRNAVKVLKIYDVKVKYLTQRGFDPQWGCPNQICSKLLQAYKNIGKFPSSYFIQLSKVEKAYQQIIETISNNPQQISEENITEKFRDCVKVQQKITVQNKKLEQKQQLLQQDLQIQNLIASYDSEKEEKKKDKSKFRRIQSTVIEEQNNTQQKQHDTVPIHQQEEQQALSMLNKVDPQNKQELTEKKQQQVISSQNEKHQTVDQVQQSKISKENQQVHQTQHNKASKQDNQAKNQIENSNKQE